MTITATELLNVEFPSVSARDLVESGRCFGACLVGLDIEACNCPCNGEFHGALLDENVAAFEERQLRAGDSVIIEGGMFGVVEEILETKAGTVGRTKWVGEDGSLGDTCFPIRSIRKYRDAPM